MDDFGFYDQRAGSWWDSDGFLHGMGTLLNPVRVPYIHSVLQRFNYQPTEVRFLDVGCGGGLLAEALVQLGYAVTGLDRSLASVAAGDAHADRVQYLGGEAGRLPFRDGSFHSVALMEVLEHVTDPIDVIVEAGRVLTPGGFLFFAGPNRTRLSRLILIRLAQEWRWSALLPADLHRLDRFITPGEATRMAEEATVRTEEIIGVGLRARQLPGILATLAALRFGRITYAEAGRRARLHPGRNRAVAYMGYGRRT